MTRLGRLAIVGTVLMLAPLGRAEADTYAVVFNQSSGQINVSNNRHSMDPKPGEATWSWLDLTVTSGSLNKSWHVQDMGIKCGDGWVIRATSSSSGAYQDTCLQIPWGQVGCVGILLEDTGLRIAQIPWQSCSNSWWEQAGSPEFLRVLDIVTRVAAALP